MLTVIFASTVLAIAQPDLPQAPAITQPIDLTSEQRASMRCAAAFAIVAHGQSNGNAEALKWPKMGERGREFFVQVTAQLMDETNANRPQITKLLESEAQSLIDAGEVESIMPACLLMLQSSKL